MEFGMLDPPKGVGVLIQEDQEVHWAIASARIYQCGKCDMWHANTDEEASEIWRYN